MSINKKDFFDDDFEVIYEGDLPDLPEENHDDYEDVLQKLADLDKEYETSYHSRKPQGNNRNDRFSDHNNDYDYDDYDYDDDYDDDGSRRRSKKGQRAESKKKKKKRKWSWEGI